MKKKFTHRQGGRQNERPDTDLKPTAPSEWKAPDKAGDLISLPSGNVVRCLRPGMDGFLELGIIPNALLPIVDAALTEHKVPTMEQVIEDQSTLVAAAKFTDDVVLHCVMEPKIYPTPDVSNGEAYEPGRVYLENLTDEDKVFIFQFAVGGTRSVQRFRESQVADVAALADGLVDTPTP